MKRTYTIHHLSNQKFSHTSNPSSCSWPYDYVTEVAKITIEVEWYIKDPAYYLLDVFRLAQTNGHYWAENPEVSDVKPKEDGKYVGDVDKKWRSIAVGDVISDDEGNVHRVVPCDFAPLILKGVLL